MIGDAQDPVTHNAADEEEAAQVGDELELARQAAIADTKELLRDEDSRRRYIALVAATGVFDDITGDPETVYRKLGRRSVGLQLLGAAEAHPELFAQMWVEHLKRSKSAAALRKARRTPRQGGVR